MALPEISTSTLAELPPMVQSEADAFALVCPVRIVPSDVAIFPEVVVVSLKRIVMAILLPPLTMLNPSAAELSEIVIW